MEFEFTSEYFLDISRKCRYNEKMADFYDQMAELKYDEYYPLGIRDEDRGLRDSDDFKEIMRYGSRAESIRSCMKYGWTSDYYRMSGVKVVKGVNRCRDRFCYNCQSMDSLQRFHEYAPIIDSMAKDYDIYHVVFSQPNVPGFILNQTLDLMQKSFSRFIAFMNGKKKIRGLDLVGAYGYVGAVRALEVSQNDRDSNYHPHYHCFFVLKKGIDVTPKHFNMFSVDKNHYREDRYFSDFEVFLQRIWYLLMNGIKVTLRNLENLPQMGGKRYPDGFSCFAENAKGKYHEVFKYATKGSYKNGSILNDFECFRTLYVALFKRRIYQTCGCFYGVDMNEIHEGLWSNDISDLCFNEIIERLNDFEQPVFVVEELLQILKCKVPSEGKGVRYISAQSVRFAFDEVPQEKRAEVKDRIMKLLWTEL